MQIKPIFVDICIYLNLLGWLSLVWGLIADPPPTKKHLKLALLVHFWHKPLLLSSMLLCDFCSHGIQSMPRISSHLSGSDNQGLYLQDIIHNSSVFIHMTEYFNGSARSGSGAQLVKNNHTHIIFRIPVGLKKLKWWRTNILFWSLL